jgi:outer membrane receptor protein involved in Fe transport
MKKVHRAMFVLLTIAVFLGFVVLLGQAQTSNGVIAGAIVDKSSAGVPNATVSATSEDRGGEPRVVETDSVGSYRIESLLPGRYTLVIKKAGFADVKVSGLEVKASLTTTFNGTLELAAQTATITVEASTGQEIQTQSGDLSSSITSNEVGDLPIFGLNPIALILTQPGVQDPGNRGISNGVNFSVNGTRPRANNFLIDGQDNNDNAINGQAFQPINKEAISEVTVLTNSYGAEFGRGGGSVTNVIYKGGTNDFHGSAWELATNSDLATAKHEDLFAGCATTVPPSCHPVSVENTFGFAFGGPIKRNKLFVFGSSQWDRTRSTNNGSTITAPTAGGIAALQALNSPNANFLVAAFAGLTASAVTKSVPIGSATPGGTNRGSIDFGLVQRSGIGEIANDRQWDMRMDFTPSDRDSLMGRYYRDDGALTPDLFNFPRQLAPFDSQQGGPSQSFAGGWTHTLSSKAINELRVSYTNIGFSFGPTPATASNPLAQLPQISIVGVSSAATTPFPTLGFPSNLPQGRAHKSYQYQDALSYTIGRHTFKGGADINHLSVVDSIPFNSRGTITFFGGSATDTNNCGLATGCTGLANFIDNFTGPSGAVSKVFGSPILQPFVTTYAPYVQDTWRMRDNFTLTLGLRYEYWGVPENVLQFPAITPGTTIGMAGASFPAVYSAKQPADRNNFGPRVGIAYTPRFWKRILGDSRPTVFRLGYGIFYDGLFTNILDNTGGTSPNAVGGTLTGASTENGGRGLANATGLLNSVAPLLNPRATVDTIASNLMNPMTQQWNFDIQRELPAGFVITAAYVGTRGEHLFVNQQYNPGVNGVRMNPALGSVVVRTNGADSIYHAGQLNVDRKFSRGLLLRAAYTFSKLIDDASEVFTISQQSSFSENPFNQGLDRGPSLYDRRQRLVLTYIWDVPYVHSKDNVAYRMLNAVTAHWQWSGFATFQTGQLETIISGHDNLGDLNGTNDRPNLVNASLPQGDFNRYAPAASGTLGNLGRNTYVGPNQQYWDMAIQRMIPIGFHHMEQQTLTLRAEFFNTLNHANRFLPDLNLADGASTTPGDGGFGDIVSTVQGQRQIKIYLKYSF